ncbi:platelet glycoprotein Ib alpha chain, partial [Scomber scombrus]
VLLFPSNLFPSLSWSSFQTFTELYEIDLTGNQVPELTPSSVPVLPTLSVLRLGSNRLKSLSDNSFSACPALTELHLENNAINSLSDHTFSGLSKLEILDLSYNHIRVLPLLLLHPLPAIETLLLENNKIKVLPDNWFSQKEEVPYLYLSANPWACFCSLGYLRRYLDDYDYNVYVRDGINIMNDGESVVCDSPQAYKGKPVVTLEESDLCSAGTEPDPPGDYYQPATTFVPYMDTAAATTALSTRPTYPTIQPTTESLDYTTIVAKTTQAAPTTVPSTTPKLQVVTTTAATEITTASTPSWVIANVAGDQQRSRISGAAAGVFCFWLFVGALLLCVAAAACILVTVARLIIWYRRVYKPLSAMVARRGRGGGEGMRLLTYSTREGQEVAVGGGGGGGVMALYRSVLFISREEGEAEEKEGRGRKVVTLEPTGGGRATREEEKEGGREERGVYRKTIHRLVSKQEEVEGWTDEMEEHQVSAEDGRKQGGVMEAGGVSRKRYSVILREEREEAGGGREEQNWVVGGWEVKRGGGEEEPRSSWGEWLANYLPSMPWGVTAPPEDEGAQ